MQLMATFQTSSTDEKRASAKRAVITVYLSLVLILLLALLTTTLEAARLSGLRYMADSMSELASESVLADYNDALYDRYHIFGKTTLVGTESQRASVIDSDLQKMLAKNQSADGAYLWKFSGVETEVSDCPSLIDYDGAFFRQQAVCYMEYRGIGAALESLLASLDIFCKTEDTLELISRKQEAENALSEIDRRVLQLIEKVEGVRTDDKGIKLTLFGNISTATDFVKRILQGSPSMQSVAVNNETIFEALKGKYSDPMLYIEEMQAGLDLYDRYIQEKQELLQNIENLELASEGTDGLSEKLSLGAKILALKAENAALDLKISSAKGDFKRASNALLTLVNGSRGVCKEAQKIMDEIKNAQELASPLVQDFAGQLEEAEGWLDTEVYEELTSDLDTMEAYLGEGVSGLERVPDFEGMRTTIDLDEVLLLNMSTKLLRLQNQEFSSENRTLLEELVEIAKTYSIESLSFDYTGMSLKAEKISPLDSIKKLLSSGLSGLVLPEGFESSKKAYSDEELPSDSAAISLDKTDDNLLQSGSLTDTVANSPLTRVKNLLAEGTSALAEKSLFLAYLNDHFSSYEKEKDEASVCQYELEYILCGHKTDKQNLDAVVSRLLLTRFIFCLVHVLSDGEKTTTARDFSMSLLGFTGMPMLVEALKYIIVFVWSFDEALVETAAIMEGKKVALIPTKANFQVEFTDLLLVNRSYIKQAVSNRPDDVALSLNYTSYLNLFLLLENEKDQNMRCMDVIQENLRLSEDNFRMAAMLYGFNAKYVYELEPVFGLMPFSTGLLGKKYKYTVIGGAKY